MKENKQQREVVIKIPVDTYMELENTARKMGFTRVEDYIVHIIVEATSRKPSTMDIEQVKSRLERFIQDEINKRLTVVETLKRQVVELYEKIEELTDRVKNIEEAMKTPPAQPTTPEKPREAPPRKTAIERLREEKVVYESALPARINRDRYFAHLERMGAVVLKLSKERIAVDQEFWREFREKLESLTTNIEEEIQRALGDIGFKLWKSLYSDNLIYFDPKTRKWRFIEPVK